MTCTNASDEGGRQVLACAYNSSATEYITAGTDNKINVYDETTRQLVRQLEPR